MVDIQEAVIKDIDLTPIQNFYHNANILITGGTGFVGRLLVEKLLRSCPTVSTIYLIVRNKKGKNLTTRVDELVDDVVFSELKKQCPKFRHKIVGVEGDCSLPQLGLSETDRQMLIENVSIVFHAAATVKFDEKINLATSINVKGPLSMLDMVTKMKKLKSFIHVSTAYANCVQPVTEEKVYPPPIDGEEFLKIVDNVPEKLLCNMTKHILDKYPNTYTFTKSIAEDFVSKKARGYPAGIFRPSIIISTYKEPVHGWINNVYGLSGISGATGSGILRTMACDGMVNANVVPGDMCVNSLIAVAWEVGSNFEKDKESNSQKDIPIYNFESSNDQPITWDRLMNLSMEYGVKFPPVKAMWYSTLTFQKYKPLYILTKFILHILPALIVDSVLWCGGKDPMLLGIYKKVHKFLDAIEYFSTRDFRFKSNLVQQLIRNMSKADRELFFCDLCELDWNEYFREYFKGLRVYLLHDDISTLDEARVRWRRLYYLHNAVKLIAAFVVIRILWSFISYFYGVFFL